MRVLVQNKFFVPSALGLTFDSHVKKVSGKGQNEVDVSPFEFSLRIKLQTLVEARALADTRFSQGHAGFQVDDMHFHEGMRNIWIQSE